MIEFLDAIAMARVVLEAAARALADENNVEIKPTPEQRALRQAGLEILKS